MIIEYNPDGDLAYWTLPDSDITVQIGVTEFLEALPQDIEIVRLHYLLGKINEMRNKKLKTIGIYEDMITQILLDETNARGKQKDAIEAGKLKLASAYGRLVQSCLMQKNTANELRHSTKLTAIQEARFMALLAQLEV